VTASLNAKANTISPVFRVGISVNGTVTADVFVGNGSQLWGITVNGTTVKIAYDVVTSVNIANNAIASINIVTASITMPKLSADVTENYNNLIASYNILFVSYNKLIEFVGPGCTDTHKMVYSGSPSTWDFAEGVNYICDAMECRKKGIENEEGQRADTDTIYHWNMDGEGTSAERCQKE